MDSLAAGRDPPLGVHEFEIVELRRMRKYTTVEVNLKAFARKKVVLRLCQTILVPEHAPGSACWRNIRVEEI